MDDMTLGEATELLAMPPWACACTGPWPPPCNCQRVFAEARQLRRAAHIVAKLLVTHSDRVDGS